MDRPNGSGFDVRLGLACGAVTRSPLRGLAQESWLKSLGSRVLAQESWLRSLGSGRYVGASHGFRRALLLPGRICDMNRRERRTLNIMSVALLGAKLAHRPGDIAA